jgi:hypothetical protein
LHTHIILLSVFENIFLQNKSVQSGMENTNDEIKSFLEKLRLQNSVLKKLLDIFQNASGNNSDEENQNDKSEDFDNTVKEKK